jgi:membrane associated rhomboid family serine protease
VYGRSVFPLRDTIPSARPPIVNTLVIVANVVVFLYELTLGTRVENFFYAYGLVPRDFAVEALFASMFLHASWFHLGGNMLFLYIFGDNVEDRLGHLRYAAFYVVCGVAAAVSHLYTQPHSGVPVVGASGAIAGILGAYFVFFPRSRVVTLVPFSIYGIFRVFEIPAVFFLAMWFLMQVASGVATLGATNTGGVAFWAHVGGFVSGVVLGPLMRRRDG